jgi:hypothetical protein
VHFTAVPPGGSPYGLFRGRYQTSVALPRKVAKEWRGEGYTTRFSSTPISAISMRMTSPGTR